MKKFEFIDHTADVMFKAYGKDVDELFTNAATALQEIQVATNTINPKRTITFTLHEKKIEDLLFDFLQEFIFLKDSEEILFSSIQAEVHKEKDRYTVHAVCKGDTINHLTQKLNVDAKAITMHLFEVKENDGIWTARVIVDI